MGKLTALKVQQLTKPGSYGDGDCLYLYVKSDGASRYSRSWVYRFTLNGRRREMGLGPANVVTLAEARLKVLACPKMHLEGIDPIKAVEKVLAHARRIRNDFAHHIRGASKAVPKALLLIDPKCLRQHEVEKVVGPGWPPQVDRSQVMVWREPDLSGGPEPLLGPSDAGYPANFQFVKYTNRPRNSHNGKDRSDKR